MDSFLNIGDMVYQPGDDGNVYRYPIVGVEITYLTEGFAFSTAAIGESVFLTAEDAKSHYNMTAKEGNKNV